MDQQDTEQETQETSAADGEHTAHLDNIDYIRYLNRIILEEAFRMMRADLPERIKKKPSKPAASRQKKPKSPEMIAAEAASEERLHPLWGKEFSAMDILEDIADTELKIEKFRPSGAATRNPLSSVATPSPLSEADVQLVRRYIRRQTEGEEGDGAE